MTTPIKHIALIGATGNLGPTILSALLAANYHVTILTRSSSTSTTSIPAHPNQKILKVDFSSLPALTAALKGIEGVVSNIAVAQASTVQRTLIDAAIAAGTVRRFLPSEFGSDLSVQRNAAVPMMQGKIETTKYLEEQAALHPHFTYSVLTNGPFFDWGLSHGLFGDVKNHTITLWDGGETKFSTTPLPLVGKAVAAVFGHLEETKNRHVYVQGTVISQREIMSMVKEIDGVEWTVEQGTTVEAYRKGVEELKKEKPDMMVAIMGQLCPVVFSKEHEPDFSKKVDMRALGLEEMSQEQVRDVVRKAVLG